MNSMYRILSAGILLSLAAGSALARTRVAMPDFATDDNSCRSMNAGAQAAATLQTQLADIADIDWVERAELGHIISEVNLARSALATADAIRVGRILKADIVIRGRFVINNKERQWCIEAIDLARAEVLSTRAIACFGSAMDPVELTPEWLATAATTAREVVKEGVKNLKRTQTQRTVGGLFIRNISPNSRLNFIDGEILQRLESATNQTSDLRWLKFSRISESLAETQLSILGITSPDPAAWRAPADLFLWGSVEEQPGYTGPAEKVPFTLTLEVWNGTDELQKITSKTTLADWRTDVDRAATELLTLARNARPADTPATRAAIAKKLLSRGQQAYYTPSLLELARFFSPDDAAIQKQALERRSYSSQNNIHIYTHSLTLAQDLAAYADQYPSKASARKVDAWVWPRFISHLQKVLEIEQQRRTSFGLPYDFNPDAQKTLDDRLVAIAHQMTLKFAALRNQDPQNSDLRSNDSLCRFANAILNSKASVDARIQLIEILWPWLAPYYQKNSGSSDSTIIALKNNLTALYENASRPERAQAMLTEAISETKPVVITVDVPRTATSVQAGAPGGRAPRPLPPDLPPEIQERMRQLERLRAGPAAAKPQRVQEPSGPVSTVPLMSVTYEVHNEINGGELDATLRSLSSSTQLTYGYRTNVDAGAMRSGNIPLVMSGDTLWILRRERSSSSLVAVMHPAFMQTSGPLYNHTLLKDIVGLAVCDGKLFGASSSLGLLLASNAADSPARAFGGADGLATTNLDAIVSDGKSIFLAGHQQSSGRAGSGRIIRFDPATQRFEDLLVGLPANDRLWVHGNTLVFRGADGWTALDLASRAQFRLAEALQSAGWSPKQTFSAKRLRFIGLAESGFWLIADNQIIGLSADRKKILATIPLDGANVEAIELSQDGMHAFLVVNVSSTIDREDHFASTCSYLLVADLSQAKMVAQCRVPGRHARMLCAANRIWLSAELHDPMIAINRRDLKLPDEKGIIAAPTATPEEQIAIAAYNNDVTTLRALIARHPSALNGYIKNASHRPYQCAFQTASIETIKAIMGDGGTALAAPEDTMGWAALRNMPDLIARAAADSVSPDKRLYDAIDSPLMLAIGCGNEPAVSALLAAGADVKKSGQSGDMPLTLAAAYASPTIVETILSAKPQIDAAQKEGFTVLHLAVMRNNPQIVKLLLDRGANPNLFSSSTVYAKRAMTPLMIAVKNRNRDIATLLLAKGARVNDANPEGLSALSLASEQKNDAMIELLRQNGAALPPMNATAMRSAISSAISHRDLGELKRLLDAGADVNVADANGVYPIAEAGNHGSIEQIAELLKHGARPDRLVTPESGRARELVNETTCRRIAIAQGQLAGVATTQFSVPQISTKAALSLADAIEAGDSASALAALHRGQRANTANDQWPLLHRAVARHMTDLIAPLINEARDPDRRGPQRMTPLMLAAAGDDAEMIQLLLKLGAQIHLQNSDGKSAVELARMHGAHNALKIMADPRHAAARAMVEVSSLHYDNTLKVLLEKGLPVNVADVNGQTPLMAAARARAMSCMSLLLAHKADLNQKDLMGRTALHWAVLAPEDYTRAETIRLLVKAGADPDMPDINGITPRQYSTQYYRNDPPEVFDRPG